MAKKSETKKCHYGNYLWILFQQEATADDDVEFDEEEGEVPPEETE